MTCKNILLIIFSTFWFFLFCGQNTEESNTSEIQTQSNTSDDSKGIPVEAMVIRTNAVTQTIPLTGILKPLHEVDIVAEVSGKIVRINKELGDRVNIRDSLAFIDDKIPLSNYRQAQSQVISAENNLKISELNLASDKELYKNEDISQLAYENSLLALKTAKANLMSALANLSIMEKNYKDTRIISPINGLISRKYIDLGTMVSINSPLYRVVDIQTLKIEVGFPQSYISLVKENSLATIKVSALNDADFSGRVKYISPQADETTGTFTGEIHVANTPNLRLRAGMTARAEVVLNGSGKSITVPDYAVVTKEGKNFVYRINGGKAQLTDITITENIGSQFILSDGLVEGDTIVVVGMKNLGMDSKVWIETVH